MSSGLLKLILALVHPLELAGGFVLVGIPTREVLTDRRIVARIRVIRLLVKVQQFLFNVFGNLTRQAKLVHGPRQV
jgi:hypothetical protein